MPKKVVDMENTPYLWFVRPVWSKVLLLAVFLPANCVFLVRDTCTERVLRLFLELVNLAEYNKGWAKAVPTSPTAKSEI